MSNQNLHDDFIITDNVWGPIPIEREFMLVLSFPEMQRLKEKRQLGIY